MPHQHHSGHQHHHRDLEELERRQNGGGSTVVQYVYATAAKTFDGPVGGYVTQNPPAPVNTPAQKQAQAQAQAQPPAQPAQQQNVQQENWPLAAALSPTTTPSPSPPPSPQPQPQSQPQPQPVAVQNVDTNTTPIAAPNTTPSEQQVQATPVQNTQQVKAQTPSPAVESISATSPTVAQVQSVAPSVQQSAIPSSSSSTSSFQTSPSATSSFAQPTTSSAPTHATEVAASGKPTASPTPVPSSSSGMSSGAKAGLAIGILLAIGAVLALIFFLFRRKRKQTNEAFSRADDEKSAYAADLTRAQSTRSTRTTGTAPRLSLRPATEFVPDLAGREKGAKSAAAAPNGTAAGGFAAKDHISDPENPFGNHAEPSEKTRSTSSAETVALPTQANTPENPFGNHAEIMFPNNDAPVHSSIPPPEAPAPLRIKTPSPETVAAAAGSGAGAIATTKLAEKRNGPKPLNISPNRSVSPSAPSPVGSEYSQTSVTAAALVNGPAPSNVHRIQLDFKPSMDDELALRAGQLVRLLHEYDDGWALCIRLDRSQQGVAPRTCLSARPVKPRPPPGARGPGPRGPPPGMMGPGNPRPSSPASGRDSPSPTNRAPRPVGPGSAGGQQRPMSPGATIPTPGGKPRSNSASETHDRRNSPPGPSPMNPNTQRDRAMSQSPPQSVLARKPVPGQAM